MRQNTSRTFRMTSPETAAIWRRRRGSSESQKARKPPSSARSAASALCFSSTNLRASVSTFDRYTRTSSRRYCASRHLNGAVGRSLQGAAPPQGPALQSTTMYPQSPCHDCARPPGWRSARFRRRARTSCAAAALRASSFGSHTALRHCAGASHARRAALKHSI